uniref:Uncharacterized protein n=1 Tax=Arundo donax TaxID=35708 RepID=A0A0A9EIT1_ARUDO
MCQYQVLSFICLFPFKYYQ